MTPRVLIIPWLPPFTINNESGKAGPLTRGVQVERAPEMTFPNAVFAVGTRLGLLNKAVKQCSLQAGHRNRNQYSFHTVFPEDVRLPNIPSNAF